MKEHVIYVTLEQPKGGTYLRPPLHPVSVAVFYYSVHFARSRDLSDAGAID